MRRLKKKTASLVYITFDKLRKRRIISAEWVSGDINDPNLVQQITDMMANGGQMQIEYNGEWKTIEPYGWNSSKAGNVLLMCYKDTGEVRSYRLDRITDVQFDSNVIDLSQYGLINEENEEDIDFPTIEDNELVDIDNEEEETPFDDAIDILEQVEEEYMIEDLRQEELQEYEPTSIEDYNPMNNEQIDEEQQLV